MLPRPRRTVLHGGLAEVVDAHGGVVEVRLETTLILARRAG
jgi:hypothetical protein